MKSGKIRILYVVSTLRQSGPTTQLLGLVRNLDKEIFEIQILTLSPEPLNSKKAEFLSANIKVDSLNLSRIQFLVRGNKILKNYIIEYNPDIVHTTGIRADLAVSKMKIKARHCLTIRNYVYEDYVAKYGKLIGKMAASGSIKAMKKCDYVICCSKSLRDMYQKILPQKLYVVQNGVETDKFTPALNIDVKYNMRSLLGIPQDQIVFLVVGSLIKRKDPISIIKAFKEVNSEYRANLILLGDGDLMEQCKGVTNENIIVKGNVNNVKDYLQASDVFISASESEGLPNSVLEAGSCGLNLILSDIPQHREVFEKELEFVKFFNVGDEKTLSLKMKEAILENNRAINYDISRFIKNSFSNKVMSKSYENMYHLMLNDCEGLDEKEHCNYNS